MGCYVILQPKRYTHTHTHTHTHTRQDPTYILPTQGSRETSFLKQRSFFSRFSLSGTLEKAPGEPALFYIKGHSLLWFMISGAALLPAAHRYREQGHGWLQQLQVWSPTFPPDGIRPTRPEVPALTTCQSARRRLQRPLTPLSLP